MSRVADFDKELNMRARQSYGKWFKIDLHNHSPSSTDYKYKGGDVEQKIADSIIHNDLSVVMFTDHFSLPDQSSVAKLAERTGRLILRGVELNVFVDAFDKAEGKVTKDWFYHLLVGFDPEGRYPPDYWLQEIYRSCNLEERPSGGAQIRGLSSTPEELAKVLKEAGAIVIPAHLHTTRDPQTSRSVDDIYSDPVFLRHVEKVFTALEVTDPQTATFFDGKHSETKNLYKACIKSSDSHEPDTLGWRHSFAQMQTPSYRELKAALELPFRTALTRPSGPQSYVIGMQVKGVFFPDLWLSFSPHCNVLIGVKGSGKTSVLECLRFALGADVPASRAQTVESHLSAILGPAGIVKVLVRRPDGAKLLIERSMADKVFQLTFEDDRQEKLTSPEGLLFPTHILGWHEIEQAATDINIRRFYMDTIAGKARIRSIEEEAKTIATQIRERHTHTSQRYGIYRDLDQQVSRLQELRKGLQQLTDANLIALRDQYQTATDQREALNRTIARLDQASGKSRNYVLDILSGQERSLGTTASPIAEALKNSQELLTHIFDIVDAKASDLQNTLNETVIKMRSEQSHIDAAYLEFLQQYAHATEGLTPDQKRLLETHREVLEQTKALASLESERDLVKNEILGLLQELTLSCDHLAAKLDERTKLRQEKTEALNTVLSQFGVRLAIKAQQQSQEFQELSTRYAIGLRTLQELRSKAPERLAHLSLKKAYRTFLSNFDYDYGRLLFDSAELSHFLSVFENDDLLVELKVGKTGQEYSPIDQLSSGQRCTAIFPILLEQGEGSLIVDQPEDNLDNRHIANFIGPALLQNKRNRQMIFTSHNANLVVLSDAESILMFESDGTSGRLEEEGFLATVDSPITHHVMDVLDGGDRALQQRVLKYGLGKRVS
jgi:hypothetical protein